ncbi:MFS transporter [Alicyclobacillus acidoterrestris]|uniref:MFS transporter n=1 Tax=Alicyclobacillus suci TaxID=2816080 RepID=UPI00119733E1|nr:MFS transporter [Alicyclobacillus suci]GEO24594.1 MFS transporter [Alicyclobacillus acidoterrestris]
MNDSTGRSGSYKWIALVNTTLGILMASINSSILIIALPVIFDGLKVNPLEPGQTGLLLWVLLGFNVATTVLLVTFGRLSDIFGRVRLYNMGFLVFTIGSVLCAITWGTGLSGEIQLIVFRVVQGIGGAFLFANSAAILTDAFPENQRGLALGLNQIAAIGGSVVGLVVGGLLAATGDWRYVFLVNVPVGLFGTIWGYFALKEVSSREQHQKLDVLGNLTLGLGILGIMMGLTYGIMPYGGHTMGWTSPTVIGSLVVGVVMLILFVVVESRVPQPLFHLYLFRSRAFTAGNIASFMSALARGGLQFMLIIWLQGIYLPLHGVSFAHTPLIAGIYTIPQMVGFLLAGPISGYLSDKFGARAFATGGLLLAALGFACLETLPSNFNHWLFWFYIFLIGAGMGLFSSPNSAAIMNAVPAKYRGVASGMRATFMNAGMMMSMGIFFSLVIAGLAGTLPTAMYQGLVQHQVPTQTAQAVAGTPPTASLFAALLGYNPLESMLGQKVLNALPANQAHTLTGKEFFPNLISGPFHHGLELAFGISIILLVIGAVASFFRGQRFVYHEEEEQSSSPVH